MSTKKPKARALSVKNITRVGTAIVLKPEARNQEIATALHMKLGTVARWAAIYRKAKQKPSPKGRPRKVLPLDEAIALLTKAIELLKAI